MYPYVHEVKRSEGHSVMSDSLRPHGLYSPWNSLGQNTGVGSLSLLQGISPTQGSNPGIPHCRWILYQLSHKGSPAMFIAAAFTRAKTQKQPKCSSMEETKKKMWYIYTMEYYLAIKKNKVMPFAATWMDLEIIYSVK